MKKELAYVLGALVGDGCLSKDRIYLTVKDEDFVDYFAHCFERVFGIRLHKKLAYFDYERSINGKRFRSKTPLHNIYCKSKEVAERITSLEFTFKTDNWSIPPYFFNEPEDVIGSFVRGFADSEGGFHNRCLNMWSKNWEGLKQIQGLLNRLGISSRLIERKARNVWHISISGVHDLTRFYFKVGFSIRRKRKKLEHYLKRMRGFFTRKYPLSLMLECYKLYQQGLGSRKIAKKVDLPHRTVSRWIYPSTRNSGRNSIFQLLRGDLLEKLSAV